MPENSTRVVYAALVGNVLVAITKFVAAFWSGSSAMLTEAIHSSADSVNQVLLLFGGYRSRAKADRTHRFGYGGEIYFWTFVVAILVLLTGGGASLWKGWHQLMAPQPIQSPRLSLGVLAISALFEGWSFSVGYREYKRMTHTHTIPHLHVGVWRFIKWSKDPNLYESLLEDLAALAGLVVAAAGVCAAGFFDVLWSDGLASCIIGLILIADAGVILVATRSLIAGEAVALPLLKDIRAAIQQEPERLGLSEDGTLHLGPASILVCLKLHPSSDTSIVELTSDLARVEEKLKAVDSRIKFVFFRCEA